MKLEYKVAPLKLELKNTDDGMGELSGCANFSGYLDDGGDIIPKGGFSNVLKSFLKGGFIALSHEWNIKDGVVGFPIEANEDENGLAFKAKFHSTSDAQDVRTKVRERQEAGLETGLSIGYRGGSPIFIQPKDYEKELPKYLKPEFLDEGLQKARRFKNVRVLPRLSELREISILTNPMNILSAIDGVKGDDERQDITFAPLNTAWDAKAAEKRVMEWSAKQSDPAASYRSAFILPDETFGKHQMPFCDIVDGNLLAVEAGLTVAVDRVFAKNVVGEQAAKARGIISAYYTKLKEQFPEVEVKVDWTPEELSEPSERALEQQSYKETCEALGVKVGARNSSPDRKRIQQMHDLTAEMEPDVCSGGYGSKAQAEPVPEVKAIFDEELAKSDPLTAFTETCIERLKDKRSDANFPAMLKTAFDSYMAATAVDTDAKDDSDQVTDLSDWKKAQFKTERLKTAAMRQRAGLMSNLLGGA